MRTRLPVLCALLLAWARRRLRVLTFLFFLVAFVVFATASRSDWYGVAVGCVLGTLFGLLFAFGDQWADIEERDRGRG